MAHQPPPNGLVAVWLRRDLRLHDQAALHAALQHARETGRQVLPLFIFDRNILDELEDQDDARVHFLHQTTLHLRQQLQDQGGDLWILHGRPEGAWTDLLNQHPSIRAVFVNRDYEPYAHARDANIRQLLAQQGVEWHSYQDHVLQEGDELRTQQGKPYQVFTPYQRAWRKALTPAHLAEHPSQALLQHVWAGPAPQPPSLADLGFRPSSIAIPPTQVDDEVLERYADRRNYPAQPGTSRLGIHLRFGTISVRQLARRAKGLSDTFLNELIWRDFYSMILQAFPQVVDHAFRPAYDRIPWRDAPQDLDRWHQGKTGYPLVDAGMRELVATGYMHNRVRMVTASFLTKHLLIDWRLGERIFARHLLDYELASNNGGWQWAAGSGTDAAPYFRIFNPQAQAKRFDPQAQYIRQWVPEYGTPSYPAPMVDHQAARQRCLDTYKAALDQAGG